MKLRLGAINSLLSAIGEITLVDEADFEESDEGKKAEIQLLATLDSVLSRGWKFNKMTVDLQPDVDGYISVPPSALVMNFNDPAISINEGLLFDKVAYTSIFTSAVSVEIIYRENFDFVPIVIQEYVVAKATEVFQINTVNDAQKDAVLKQETREKSVYLQVFRINQVNANGADSRFGRNSNPTR